MVLATLQCNIYIYKTLCQFCSKKEPPAKISYILPKCMNIM